MTLDENEKRDQLDFPLYTGGVVGHVPVQLGKVVHGVADNGLEFVVVEVHGDGWLSHIGSVLEGGDEVGVVLDVTLAHLCAADLGRLEVPDWLWPSLCWLGLLLLSDFLDGFAGQLPLCQVIVDQHGHQYHLVMASVG